MKPTSNLNNHHNIHSKPSTTTQIIVVSSLKLFKFQNQLKSFFLSLIYTHKIMSHSQDTKIVAKTIAATATVTIALTAIILISFYKFFVLRRRGNGGFKGSFRREDVTMARKGLKPKTPNGLGSRSIDNDDDGDIVNGFSPRKLEGGQIKTSTEHDLSFPKFVFNPSFEDDRYDDDDDGYDDDRSEEKRVLDAASERDQKTVDEAMTMMSRVHHQPSEVKIVCDESNNNNNPFLLNPIKPTAIEQTQTSFEFAPLNFSSNQSHQTSSDYTQTLSSPKRHPPPPPAEAVPASKSSSWISSRRTSFTGRGKAVNKADESSNAKGGFSQTTLKPLHWDKVYTPADRSTVWDEIDNGSFRFDDELMERLFGYTPKNSAGSSQRANILSALTKSSSSPPTQIFLLDPRRSENMAIVLRSLPMSRREIIGALTEEGHELGSETLEKLTKISPNRDEISKILRFDGNPSKLADAESFFFHVLSAVPSAFSRLEALLFRSKFGDDVAGFRESLRTLESACRELRSRGIFQRLLEAILRAGNKMNEGTPCGNAQGFNLNALKKLSDVKSNDGETNLLRFVVEEVSRSEGENLRRRGRSEEMEDPVALGLASVEAMSSRELSGVKRAAAIDYCGLICLCDGLAAKSIEIRRSLEEEGQEGTWFHEEMIRFVDNSDREILAAREEQIRVMEIVQKTTEYYQAGERGSLRDKKSSYSNPNPKPFELFVIVKDFVDVVDQVCVEINRKLRQKRNGFGFGFDVAVSPPPLSSAPLSPPRRPYFSSFRASFASEKSLSSTESEDEF